MKVTVTFEMSVDEQQFGDYAREWSLNRIEAAVEETVRAVVGFSVPFARDGGILSVGSFAFVRHPSPETGTAAVPTEVDPASYWKGAEDEMKRHFADGGCKHAIAAAHAELVAAAGPAPEPVKPPATCGYCGKSPPGTHWGYCHARTPAAGTAPTPEPCPHGNRYEECCWKGAAPEPVKPPAHPLFPDPRTVCKPCDGTGRDTRVPANGWDVACTACNGTGRTPAAGTAPKGEK